MTFMEALKCCLPCFCKAAEVAEDAALTAIDATPGVKEDIHAANVVAAAAVNALVDAEIEKEKLAKQKAEYTGDNTVLFQQAQTIEHAVDTTINTIGNVAIVLERAVLHNYGLDDLHIPAASLTNAAINTIEHAIDRTILDVESLIEEAEEVFSFNIHHEPVNVTTTPMPQEELQTSFLGRITNAINYVIDASG